MNFIRFIFFFISFFILTCEISAKPALRGLRTVEQPDGSQLQVRVIGDENMHFTTTPDGFLLHKDSDGFYRLGDISDDSCIISSGFEIRDTLKGKGIKADEEIVALLNQKQQRERKLKSRSSIPQSGLGLFSNSYPVTGNPKCLIILVEYKDVKFKATYDARSYFHNMINGENFMEFGGTGSVLQYFRDQSGGKFSPSFDVYGPVTLPNKQLYYGQNDKNGNDINAHMMIADAVSILDPDVDFSQYDTDNDGYIDNVYVFYAGQGEADYGSDNTVWPHSWELLDAGVYLNVDNVTVNRYACSNEWGSKSPDGIGTFVHEFSHVMGLPDLYHTTNNGMDYTPGTYSVMDYGCYNNDSRTPSNYSAYEKNALGWYDPIMINKPMTVSLQSIDTGEFGLIPTEKSNEFFLFENRQQKGWDKYIPGHGMLIWHIDFNENKWFNNIVNNIRSHQYVDIVEANNRAGSRYEANYTFPGTTNSTSFTSETTPAFKSWANIPIDYPITDIAEKEGVITFNVAGGPSKVNSLPSSNNAEPEYYSLQGVRISEPKAGDIVIVREGNSVKKIVVKNP